MGIPVGRSFEIAYAQLRMLLFSAGMCVGWSFEIACARLRMLLLSAGMCRMAVRNRLCSAVDVILSLLGCVSDGRSKSLMLGCGCYCSLSGCASDSRSNHLILHFALTTKEFVTEEYRFCSIGSMWLAEVSYLACRQLFPRSDMEATLFALVFHVAVALVAQLFQYCSQCLCQLLLACRLSEKRLAVKAHIGNVKGSAILMG